jgi:hypothetical protein
MFNNNVQGVTTVGDKILVTGFSAPSTAPNGPIIGEGDNHVSANSHPSSSNSS